MRPEKKPEIFLFLFIIAVIAVTAIVYIQMQDKNTGLFPEKLGDMELRLHREGDVAINEIKGSHSAKDNVDPEEAHIAQYRKNAVNRATVSVTIAETSQKAIEKVERMNLGMGGMFSAPETLDINGTIAYYTTGGGEYHYYYAKNDLVVWITLTNPERKYQSDIMIEAIKNIGN